MLLYIQSDLYSAYEKNNLVHTVQGQNTPVTIGNIWWLEIFTVALE